MAWVRCCGGTGKAPTSPYYFIDNNGQLNSEVTATGNYEQKLSWFRVYSGANLSKTLNVRNFNRLYIEYTNYNQTDPVRLTINGTPTALTLNTTGDTRRTSQLDISSLEQLNSISFTMNNGSDFTEIHKLWIEI